MSPPKLSVPSGSVETGGRRPSRRTFLLALAAAGCATGEYDGPHRTLRIAAGEPGGFYYEFASLLAAELTQFEPDLPAKAVPTTGSVANLDLLRDRRADLALALADTAYSATKGTLRALGRVYENYMQLVVAADSPIRSVTDLTGRRISLGATGSGAAVFGERLLRASGVTAIVDHHPLAGAIAEMAAGRIDALLWSGGVPTPALADLDRRRPVRLVAMTEHLDALRQQHGPVYERVRVPNGGYGDPETVATIGVANLLVTATSLPDDVAGAVARLLVRRAPRLVPPQALGTQYLDQRSLIATGQVPLHPGAAAAYRDLRG